MRTFQILLAALFLLPAACKDAEEQPEPISVSEAIPSIILPPNAEFVSRSGSQDAAQITYSTPLGVPAVADFYRGHLGKPPWRLQSDTRSADSAVVLYAEYSGRPVWVNMRTVEGKTHVTLAGAIPGADTSYVRRQAEAHDTMNTLRPR